MEKKIFFKYFPNTFHQYKTIKRFLTVPRNSRNLTRVGKIYRKSLAPDRERETGKKTLGLFQCVRCEPFCLIMKSAGLSAMYVNRDNRGKQVEDLVETEDQPL